MEAIILAGGFGTRLRHVVPDLPKPMAPVGGKPFLEILLGSLCQQGFSRIVLSLGFMAEKISSYFGNNFNGVELVYVIEDSPLGTGGAMRLAMSACHQDHVFVFNGDTFLDFNVHHAEQQWSSNGHTIIVSKYIDDTTRYGRLLTEQQKVIRFEEKGQSGPGLINAGCYILSTNALNKFPLNQPFSFETEYLAPALVNEVIETFVADGIFIDIGVPEDFARSQTLLAGY